MTRLPLLALGGALLVAGCHAKQNPGNTLDAMDNELVEGTATDERGNLADAIKVDPARARHSRVAAAAPATTEDRASGTCLARNKDKLAFATGWAAKLPADLPLPPKAQLEEAAGRSADCEIRAASFSVPEAPEAVLAWYEDTAAKGGYDAGRTTRDGERWIAGTKGDAAFTIMTRPAKGGTAVDYIWTKGA